MGTTTGLRPGSMVYDPDTKGFRPAGSTGTARDFIQDYPDQLTGAVTSAQASDALASQLEERGVPDNVSAEDYFTQIGRAHV